MAPSRKASAPAPVQSNLVDLDSLLAEIDLSPVPVVLQGHTYMVRRDLTGPETVECWKLVRSGQDQEALAIVVGDDAEQLNSTLESLPQPRMKLAVQHIMETAGLVQPTRIALGTDQPGESLAS